MEKSEQKGLVFHEFLLLLLRGKNQKRIDKAATNVKSLPGEGHRAMGKMVHEGGERGKL